MRAMLVLNPTAGQLWLNRQIEEAIQYLQQHGWRVDLRTTEKAGDATSFTREAVDRSYDIVIAAGGDGTINEVINGGLVGSDVSLGLLPTGTTNVFALEVGIPVSNPLHLRPILDSARVLVEGRVQRIDVGQAKDRLLPPAVRHWLGCRGAELMSGKTPSAGSVRWLTFRRRMAARTSPGHAPGGDGWERFPTRPC